MATEDDQKAVDRIPQNSLGKPSWGQLGLRYIYYLTMRKY